MYFPLKTPNIPQSKVTVAAVSSAADKVLFQKLNELDIEVIKTQKSKNVSVINNHTDLFILNDCEAHLIIDESQSCNIVNFLTIGYSLTEISSIKSPYPNDCGLNCVIMGDKIICNKNIVSPQVLHLVNNLNYKLIDTNQGYSKCSACVINKNALITDDESIYKVCQNNQIDSILISKGSVKLKGFDYGFIGGCTGLIDKNKLLFNGDVNYHSDCDKIIDFISKHSIEPVIIPGRRLEDIGSIIPLCEKNIINI